MVRGSISVQISRCVDLSPFTEVPSDQIATTLSITEVWGLATMVFEKISFLPTQSTSIVTIQSGPPLRLLTVQIDFPSLSVAVAPTTLAARLHINTPTFPAQHSKHRSKHHRKHRTRHHSQHHVKQHRKTAGAVDESMLSPKKRLVEAVPLTSSEAKARMIAVSPVSTMPLQRKTASIGSTQLPSSGLSTRSFARSKWLVLISVFAMFVL